MSSEANSGGRTLQINDDGAIVDRRSDAAETNEREQLQAFLLKLSDALRAQPDADSVATCALRMLFEQLRLDRCYVGVYRLGDDRGDFTHQVGNDRVPPLPASVRLSDFPDALRVAVERTLVKYNVEEIEGLGAIDRQNLGALGMRALVAASVRHGDNNPIWSIVAVSARPRRWTRGEIELLENVAERAWAAIERARAEDAVRKSEEQYRYLFESIDAGFCTIEVLFDSNGRPHDYRFLEVNPAFVRLTGIVGGVGRTMREFAPEHEQFWFDIYGEVARTGESVRFEHEAAALDHVYDVFTFRVGLPGENRVAVIFNDIRDRKRAERALHRANEFLEQRVRERTAEVQALVRRVISIQEEERGRVARDIHDQLGQQMTALRMNLELLAAPAGHDDALAAQVARALQLAEEVDRSVDFLTWDLRPAQLDHLGLAAALSNLAKGWSERFGIAAEFDALNAESLRLPRETESNLYRIAQEALHNVVKHAQAGHVAISLQRQKGDVVLVIEDDGCGFDIAETSERIGGGRFGLVSMRERAALIGGTIDIETRPGDGTVIVVRAPITEADQP